MSKIINGVASEYDMPMVYENKSTTNRIKNEEIFTRWQDPTIEKLQQENEKLRQENQQLKDKMNFSYHIRNDTTSIPAVVRKANDIEVIKKLQQENIKLNSVLKEIREYIDNYDVFKEFSFPLMKRAEENQVKSSIKYEFDKSIKKDLLEIIDKGIKENE